jgi:hypothetical protein
MSDENTTAETIAKVDTENSLFTSEGRLYIKQLRSVSEIVAINETTAQFKGEEIVKTGYVGDYKSVHLFKCKKGYFLFCNKLFTKHNWSAAAEELDTLLQQVPDKNVSELLKKELAASVPE